MAANWKTKLDDALERTSWLLVGWWDIIKWVLLPMFMLAGCFLGVCMCRALDWMVRTFL